MILATSLIVVGVVALVAIFIAGGRRRESSNSPSAPVVMANALAPVERRPISLIPPKIDESADTSGPRKPVVVASGFEDEEFSTSFATFSIAAAARSDAGRVRPNNEDAYVCLQPELLYAVADGMGGETSGEVASAAALDHIAQAITERPSSVGIDQHVRISRRGAELVAAIVDANQHLLDRIAAEPHLRGMGTTIVVLKFSAQTNRVYVAHVGDSRCYLIRNGEIRQMTKDHTYGEIAGARGGLASRLVWALGVDKEVNVEIQALEPEHGDKFLLCSDGLTKMLKDREILETVLMEPDLARCVNALIDSANDRGGADNVTVVLTRVIPPMFGKRG